MDASKRTNHWRGMYPAGILAVMAITVSALNEMPAPKNVPHPLKEEARTMPLPSEEENDEAEPANDLPPTIIAVDPQCRTDAMDTQVIEMGKRFWNGIAGIVSLVDQKEGKKLEAQPTTGRDERSIAYREVFFDNTSALVLMSSATYFRYRDRCHQPQFTARDYASFCTPDEPLIRELATKLCQGIPREQQVERIVLFVQGLPCIYDYDGKELARYPVELLYEGAGDCEDHAALAVSLLAAAGHDSLFVLAPPKPRKKASDPQNPGHALIAVKGIKGKQHITHEGEVYTVVEVTVPIPLGKSWKGVWSTLDFSKAQTAKVDAVRTAPAVKDK